MLPNEPKFKLKDLEPILMMGVTNKISEGLTMVQFGDAAVDVAESCSEHDLSNSPAEAGMKLVPIIEIVLPEYAALPGNAEVG